MPLHLRILAGLTAAVCWIALALQFELILRRVGAQKLPTIDAVVVFVMFFTTQINILAAAVTSCAAAGLTWLAKRDGLRAAVAVYLLTGLAVFGLVLQHYYHHRGLQLTADVLLHYVTPVLYAAFWLLAVPKNGLRWRDPAIWLIYPSIYIWTALLFGTWYGFFPYPIIDWRVLGVVQVGFTVVALGGVVLAIGLAAVALARRIDPAARRPS
jgi:hypothetical protein